MACGDNHISAGLLHSAPRSPQRPMYSILGDRLQQRSLPPNRTIGVVPTPPPPASRTEAAVRAQLPASVPAELRVQSRVELTDAKLGARDLAPNTAYVSGPNVYVTDENGRTAWTRGVVSPASNAPRHHAEQAEAGKVAQPGSFHGGHFIGVGLGGFPSGPNLFAQNANFNQSAFATFENEFRESAQRGLEVVFELRVGVLDAADEVPEVLLLTYTIDGVDAHTGEQVHLVSDEFALMNDAHQYK